MFLNPSTDTMLFRKTISTVCVMLAAWAVFVGGITLVLLFVISNAKPEIPGDSSIEASAADHADGPASTSPEPFRSTRASRAKPPTLDAPKPVRLRI